MIVFFTILVTLGTVANICFMVQLHKENKELNKTLKDLEDAEY
jgi:hypothetical protein